MHYFKYLDLIPKNIILKKEILNEVYNSNKFFLE